MTIDLPARPAAIVRLAGPVADLPRLMWEAFDLTLKAITAGGATPAGPPFARYLAFGPQVEAEIGFPFSGTVTPSGRVELSELPGGATVMTTHVGPYDTISEAWERVQAWMKEHAMTASGPPWEAYVTGPQDPGPPVTEIYFPIG
ncbi:MAG TPA: GyrI-like domain-containing protein [Candidatus Limnocylindrales bacterium]|nr:GyrI-like domain-containing protein [Candidatus Limnocylindrales bacterium]